MTDLKIEYIPIEDVRPYSRNAKKHPEKQIEQIKESFELFGMIDPIGIWHNEIVEGHGRYLACKELGIDVIPVIRLDHLTDKQRRAYCHIHNKLTMNSGFDLDILNEELADLKDDFDLEQFDFEIPDEEEDSYPGDERERTYNAYNLEEYDDTRTACFYQIPVIAKCDYVPDELIGFNYVLSSARKEAAVHFFIDDYQFERVWNQPGEYIPKIAEFPAALTPDFSLYMDMPMAMKIWNVYRSRLIGQMMQDAGINVIPTLQWAEPETFAFCFDGIEPGGSVAVSTVGVMRDENAKTIWRAGMDEAIKRLRPKNIIAYGTKIDYDFGKILVKYFAARQFEKGD